MGHHDDEQIGHVLTRREAISLVGVSALASMAGCATGSDSGTAGSSSGPGGSSGTTADGDVCVVKPALAAGPFSVDEMLQRSDIRTDTSTGELVDGRKLDVQFTVYDADTDCTPLGDVLVEVWHASARGVYSAVESEGTADRDFLRGVQRTDQQGTAAFTTIYPGWYPGRAVHIHFTLRSSSAATQVYEFTSQLFFDDDFTDHIYQQAPYSARSERDTLNAGDGIFQNGSPNLVLDVSETDAGLAATFDIALTTS